MKRFKFLIIVAALALVLASVFVACDKNKNKGSSEVTLSFDAAGAPTVPDSIKAKSGDKVELPALSWQGYTFDGWYIDENGELFNGEITVPNRDTVYHAKWTPLNAIQLSYSANAPRGTSARGQMNNAAVYDGDSATVAECGYTIRGYRFAGWSLTANGNIAYQPNDTIAITENTTLYAVWNLGLVDRFGGGDVIYVLKENPGHVLLSRGGKEFDGTYTGDVFTFTLPDGSTRQGKIYAENFSYKLDDVAGVYTYYTNAYGENTEDRLDRESTLTVDEYLNAVLVADDVVAGSGKVSLAGVVAFDEDSGDYVFTPNQGGQYAMYYTFHCQFNKLEIEGADPINIFIMCNAEAGVYDGYTFIGDRTYLTGVSLLLDGYGNLYMTSNEDLLSPLASGYYETMAAYSNAENTSFTFVLRLVIDDTDGYFGIYDVFESRVCAITDPNGGRGYYLQRAEYAGEYSDGTGNTLSIDGYGMFPDSAVYKENGVQVYKGSYDVTESEIFGNIVSFTTSANRKYAFLLNEDNVFSAYDGEGVGAEDEYFWLTENGEGGAIIAQPYTMIVTYQPSATGEIKGAMYRREGSVWSLVESGTLQVENYGQSLTLYQFTYDDKNIKFMLSSAYVNNSNLPTPAYVVIEENGVENYTELTEVNANGGAGRASIWFNNAIGFAIYFDGNGKGYNGAIIVDYNDPLHGTLGTLTYTNIESGVYDGFYCIIDESALTFEEVERNEYYYVEYGSLISEEPGIILDNKGNMVWRDFDRGGYQLGKYAKVGSTSFGSAIYRFTINGTTVFNFVTSTFDFVEGSMHTLADCYYRYDRVYGNGDFVQGGNKLSLDGYHNATYTVDGRVLSGEYTVDENGMLSFRSIQGETYMFARNQTAGGNNLDLLDGAYGEYSLGAADGNWYTISFDGRGTVSCDESNATGMYVRNGENDWYVIIDLDGDGAVETYRVRLFEDMFGNFCERNDNLNGLFVSNKWEVLQIDGYGSGVYYDAAGNVGVSLSYDVVDAQRGYLVAMLYTGGYAMFKINASGTDFMRFDYSQNDYLFYSANLDPISFSSDGSAFVGPIAGWYFVEDGEANVYISDAWSGGYNRVSLPFPESNSRELTYNGVKYYRWEQGDVVKDITLNGQVVFESPDIQPIDITLTFTLSVNALNAAFTSVPATLTANGARYSMTVSNSYYGRSGFYLSDSNYNNFEATANFVPSTSATITAKGGEQHETIYDPYDGQSFIDTVTFGFGPIQLDSDSTILIGELYYEPVVKTDASGNVVPFRFSASPSDRLVVETDDSGDRYLVAFTVDGVDYAISYYNFGGDLMLWQLMKYETIETSEYYVGVGRHVYSNAYDFDGFDDSRISALVLFAIDGGNRTLITEFDFGSYNQGTQAWFVAKGTYNSADGTGELGDGYWFEFSYDGDGNINSVAISAYVFKQGITEDAEIFVNFFTDAEGNVERVVAIAAYYADGETGNSGYAFSQIESVTDNGNGEYIVNTTDGTFRVVVLFDGDDHVLTEDGDWCITVEVVE